MVLRFVTALVLPALVAAGGGGGAWTRVGPHNIFNAYNEGGKGPLPMGEAGTLAGASSLKTAPDTIYAGGQNNGVSSGIIKTTDGGKHWERKSNGIWDTRILGVWVHPDDPTGNHVFTGTHSGIYETTDGAESWKLREETAAWGNVMSFREGFIQGKPYILANCGNGGIATMPRAGGTWQYIKAPGGIAPNAHLSVVVNPDKSTEVVTCIGGWGGGQLYYASVDSPTNATWTGPLSSQSEIYDEWALFPGQSMMWGKCTTPTQCQDGIHPLGQFPDLAGCQAAVNASAKAGQFKVASYTYQHNQSSLGAFAGYCYAMSTFEWTPKPQPGVDSGRAPGTFPGAAYDCANAAVDPKDRNHFLFSKAGEYRAWESTDGGKTAHEFTNHDTGVYFVMIDQQGWYYTATQAGAFVSMNGGANWSAYHVFMQRADGSVMDRVPHDYQNIEPDFRGGPGVAFPSDQGLHIVDGDKLNLTSAVGDMANCMILSALISPSADGKSRNLVCNIWDWDVVMSRDDGATWTGWNSTEKSPGSCGEGGGGQGMGASGKLLMFHRTSWWFSEDGGHNFVEGHLPGTAGSFDYVRQSGSRTEPAGTVFAIMDAPAPSATMSATGSSSSTASSTGNYAVDNDGDDDDDEEDEDNDDHHDDDDDDEDDDEDDDDDRREKKDAAAALAAFKPGLLAPSVGGNVKYLMTSDSFGSNWTWTPFPADLQAGGLTVDPTSANSLFAVTDSCLAHSTDSGKTWSACSTATGLTGRFSKLLVKSSSVMFMLRGGAVPLRTTDGGKSWQELSAAAPLFKYGATLDGSLSWTGKTLVLTGNDPSAIGRKEYGTYVWKSGDDGNTFTDETGDLVTISPGSGVWFENDFYFVTRGEGLTVKRNFEA
eukprot:g1533.t1